MKFAGKDVNDFHRHHLSHSTMKHTAVTLFPEAAGYQNFVTKWL
jgi:hypothetical protein